MNMPKTQKPNHNQLKAAVDLIFIKYVKDNSGTLQHEEIAFLINQNLKKRGLVKSEVTERDFQHFMKKADENGDGKIDKKKMLQVLKNIMAVL